MSKKLTRRVSTKHKVKIHDNRPLPEPAESMVAPVLVHPVRHVHHETHHPFGQKISPFSMAEISNALPATRSSAVYSQSSSASKTESRNTSRSTFCSGYDSADDSETFIGLHDLGSDFGESGTSFMSWSDEIDNDSTKKLQDMYDGLEKFLYDEGEFPSNAGKDLLEECLMWKDTFSYKRPSKPETAMETSSRSTPESLGTSQVVLRARVKDLALENLSSHLLSGVLDSVAADVSRLRDESSKRSCKRSRSRSKSRLLPAMVEVGSRTTALDRCLGSGVLDRLSLHPPPPRGQHSATPGFENYPSPAADRDLRAFGRKSPRQEAILRNIREQRGQCSTDKNDDNNARFTPSSRKPPWIGFANITLPPINHPHEQDGVSTPARMKGSSPRGRRTSPSPAMELRGGGLTRLNAAKKIVEQGGQSRKAKKYVVD